MTFEKGLLWIKVKVTNIKPFLNLFKYQLIAESYSYFLSVVIKNDLFTISFY